MATSPTGRPSLLRRLSSPKVMLALGGFDFVLGLTWSFQRRSRGQGLFLMVAGAVLILAGVSVRRGEVRRAKKAQSPASARGPRAVRGMASRKAAPPPAPVMARGPKAGPKARLAGPTRVKPPPPPEPRRLWRKKARTSGDDR